jgi:hypothetical protein
MLVGPQWTSGHKGHGVIPGSLLLSLCFSLSLG